MAKIITVGEDCRFVIESDTKGQSWTLKAIFGSYSLAFSHNNIETLFDRFKEIVINILQDARTGHLIVAKAREFIAQQLQQPAPQLIPA